MAQVLIVDDEREFCSILDALLRERGHTVRCVHSGEAAIGTAGERPPDIVLLDIQLDGIDGIETLRRLKAFLPDTPVIMMTAFGNVGAAVRSMKSGATDFISKPFDNQELFRTIEALLSMRHKTGGEAPAIVGESPAFREAMDMALKFAVPDINVLLLGETGTGKELFARAIHEKSKRRGGPFVAVDCSMFSESLVENELFGHEKGAFTGAVAKCVGRLEMAQGGTLFLDEIGNLPMQFQAKLLRVLQERRAWRVGGRKAIQLDVRIVSATNRDLSEAIRAGAFRQDLYYRLQEMTIQLPPLRERNGDIRLLAGHFVRFYAHLFRTNVPVISEDAHAQLEKYPWPGNVRELENAMKSAVVLAGDVVLPEHFLLKALGAGTRAAAVGAASRVNEEDERLGLEIEVGMQAAGMDLKAFGARAADRAERSLLLALIRRGRLTGAQMAKLLNVDPKTLRVKLRRYGLEARRAIEG
ncbi:MAG: sigma-54-dependent Fis family transcriptional regulator [Deltaproteobacteria bacterium]|nr:sigma-54-dependent Fis family transcriptional regulator [Deltaproteobacteria bacterium]